MKKIRTGFTLVELLVVMGIMSILIVILSEVFGAILTMKLRSEATTAVAQDSRYLLSRLSYDISRASQINSTTGSTLSLTIDGDTYLYQLDGTTMTLSINGSSPQSLSGTLTLIDSLTFTRLADLGSTESVQIVLNMESAIPLPGGSTGARELTTTVATR